jgi:hypothetical protein
MMFVSFNSNTTGITCGAETTNTSGAPEITQALTVTRQVSHMEQKLQTLRSTRDHPGFNSNMTGVTCGAAMANPFRAPEFIPVLVGFVLFDL